MERCGNCDRVIGKMETAHLWQGVVVCRECLVRLEGAAGGEQGPHVIVEATSKKLKRELLICEAFVAVSVVICVVGACLAYTFGHPWTLIVGLLSFVASAVMHWQVRLRIWWEHG